MGLRYGLSPQTELYVRTGGLHNSQRSAALGRSESRSASGFVDAWAGVSYRFATRPNKATWIGFAEVALREKHRSTSTSLKSTVLGFTTYQAFDPVVLSFTGAWRLNQKRRDGAQHYQPGHLLMFHPSLAFSVNDRITLNTGVQWTHRQATRLNAQRVGTRLTSTHLMLGVGYGFAQGNTMNATLKIHASGQNGAEFRVSWLRNF